jgi:hypothetical protein
MVDIKVWKAWGAQAAEWGVTRVYGPPDSEVLRLAREQGGVHTALSLDLPRAFYPYHGERFYVDYPPASVLLLWLPGQLYAALDPREEHGRFYSALLGLLPLAGALVATLALRRSAEGELGRVRALAFWANPAALLAALLGYQDPIFGAFALLAVLASMQGRHVLAAALLAAAGMLKPQAVLLLPTLTVVLLRETPPRTWLRAALAGLAVVALVLTPWFVQGYLLSAINGGLRPLEEDLLAAQGLNLWWVVGWVTQWLREGPWPLARILFLPEFVAMSGWDPRPASRLLLLLGTGLSLVLLWRWPREDRLQVPLSIILQTHVYALFATSVHENHTFLSVLMAPLLLGAWERGRAVLGLTSGLMLANLFLFEGLGRGIIRDRPLFKLRRLTGVDMTVLVSVVHLALLALLIVWMVRRIRSSPAR